MAIKKLIHSTLALLLVVFCSSTYAALPSDNIIRGSLLTIDTSVNQAVKQAEALYISNSGVTMGSPVNISLAHPYFQHFRISNI